MEKNLKLLLILVLAACTTTALQTPQENEWEDFPLELEMDLSIPLPDWEWPMPPAELWKQGGCFFEKEEWHCLVDTKTEKENYKRAKNRCYGFHGTDAWFWCMENATNEKHGDEKAS